MSKRFGRNRKRKMQAALEAAALRERRDVRALADARALHIMVEEALGRHSALLPPDTVSGGRDNGADEWRMYERGPLEMGFGSPDAPFVPIRHTIHRLERLRVSVRASDGPPPFGFHVRVAFAGGRVGYFLSAQAMRYAIEPVEQYLAREIATQLRQVQTGARV